jgi:hypothetical protein
LGQAYAAFKPDGPGMANLRLNGISTNQLADRRQLLSSFDGLRREVDNTGMLQAMDAATHPPSMACAAKSITPACFRPWTPPPSALWVC